MLDTRLVLWKDFEHITPLLRCPGRSDVRSIGKAGVHTFQYGVNLELLDVKCRPTPVWFCAHHATLEMPGRSGADRPTLARQARAHFSIRSSSPMSNTGLPCSIYTACLKTLGQVEIRCFK